ncbi:MAG: DUF4433 domain-containing protein [Caldilineae bacterium]|nr:MAG: DUF4433 domain-containing protein [Caldilineae bacterium]
MPVKRSEEEIRAFLKNLATQDWVKRSERRWWPHFVFHYTDIRNAARVLEDGVLYSRLQAESRGKLAVSSGSKVVLAGTHNDIKDYVRLYFRPKTPTQYHAEGIHSAQSLAESPFPDAHCPVPVFFLFDAANILSRQDCQFSDQGLGGHGYRLGSGLAALRQLPWKKIYHNTWIDWGNPASAHEIVACRNAEVIVPKQLDLESLRFVYCRSEAEKETLLFLLSPATRRHYQAKIFASARSDPFFRRRTFIESAWLTNTEIRLRFSPETQSPGPFHLRVELTTTGTFVKEAEDFTLRPPYEYTLSLRRPLSRYQIRVFLDENLAYANTFEEIDLPF